MSDGIRVLVVDDSWHTIRLLRDVLLSRGYQLRLASTDISALRHLHEWHPQVVVTERHLPEMDGLYLCRRIRAQSSVPIIMLSELSDQGTMVEALDAGADDYVTKPFSIEELLARVRVALRRSGAEDPVVESLSLGDFRIDFRVRRVYVQGREVRLTRTEFELFHYMARHPRRVLRYRTLLEGVWGGRALEQTEYLRVYVRQLRKKLEPEPSRPRYFLTEHGVGYRFDPGVDPGERLSTFLDAINGGPSSTSADVPDRV